MKLFDRKAEKKIWLAIAASIPIIIYTQWNQNRKFGITEIIITLITLLIAIGILYFLKWYSNKK
ncbi:hypothetical protein FNO01nite_34860 [Flavobacterium noncentrifugens]|uniref:Uncharacterized protein n=1 Tax=Flavobacterium noncentrifugens TaxID=1128970 RepID=A0A1G9DGU6_9FLAO|nr:hypothetical protein FNO01nite_34860 [Flavobacterium noncentrifugens]SDK63040.1 hypothetical protein SAMN04487935_3815 [Flavobacterium noncentrifugens]